MKETDDITCQDQELCHTSAVCFRELMAKLAAFVVWPFGAFLLSLRDAASRSSYLIYFLFGVALCWSMDSNSGFGVHYDDLQGIMERFRDFNMDTDQVKEQCYKYFSFQRDSPKELYGIVLMGTVKQFSQNPHVYFAISAVVYLLLMLNCLKRITSDVKFDNSVYCLVILLLFVLPRDIITVQNPRYCTAMWMAVMGTLNYFMGGRNRYWNVLWIIASPLFHSGLWAYVIIFFSGIIVTQILQDRIVWVFYLISIPFAYFSYDVVSMVDINSLPIPVNFKIWILWHFNEEAMQTAITHKGASGFYWVGHSFAFLSKTAYLVMPFIMLKFKDEFSETKWLNSLFWFFIFYASVVNFIQIVPVLGQRAYFVTRILSIFLWFKIVYPRCNKFLVILLGCCSWEIFQRYFYNGAVNSSLPRIFFIEPLPIIILNYIGAV